MDADWPFPTASKLSPVSLQRTLARSGLNALGGLVGAYFPCELDPDKPGGEAPFCPTARTTTPRGRSIAGADKSLSSPRMPAVPAPPLRKGDVVRPTRGQRWGEEGTVQTVWESSRSDRIEAVVRFKEGGGWFASEDLEFVRSGRPPASLMSRTFSARLPRITASEDAGDSAMLISDLIAGRMTAARKKEIQQRRAAEVQLMRMKEEVRRAAAAERSVEHPAIQKMFRAVMADDVAKLSDIIAQYSQEADAVDVGDARNSQGQSLLSLAEDRAKPKCVEFLQHLTGQAFSHDSRHRSPSKQLQLRARSMGAMASVLR